MNYKRKYKRGGSPQPNTTLSPEPIVSSSIKNSYSDFKDFLFNIKIYIKSNFVFVLLVSVLLIFYIYLILTDPLTQEDLQENIASIKCGDTVGGWKDGCPNKVLASDRECIGNQCDIETCCVNELQCSEWGGTCPTNFDIMDTKTCKPEIDGDCSKECCVKTCRQFLNSSCPNNQIKIADNFCQIPDGSDEYVCNYTECCNEQLTCATFSCPPGQMLSDSAASIECINNECLPIRCCNDEPTEEDSSSEAARATEALRVASAIEAASAAASASAASASAEAASMATQQALDVLGSGSTAVAGSDTRGG